jgi:hypothetical protein
MLHPCFVAGERVTGGGGGEENARKPGHQQTGFLSGFPHFYFMTKAEPSFRNVAVL